MLKQSDARALAFTFSRKSRFAIASGGSLCRPTRSHVVNMIKFAGAEPVFVDCLETQPP